MVRVIFLILVILLLNSCVRYSENEYGFFQPKHPNYSLKDKKGFIFPDSLDTLNVYRFYGYYENNKLVKDLNFGKWAVYKKFYRNGQAFSFGTEKLEENNLRPKQRLTDYYFYNSKENIINYETFVIAEGGKYIIIKYKISNNGDTLTSINNGKKSHVYIKTIIPDKWEKN
ncbi:hypothetical protein [Flavobacterium sp. CLA17]|uniref:hypothetical protein n=1 Tax=Flavobacterium sp. CLA17 TaxID=2724135 RepID=UPI001492326D|nr:hypothetical protein [Flavobacterium sp. CLA17]QSB26514.1 hypothetical protein HAV12_019440 [Flavobacterium sp. CLA17]